MPKQDKPIAVFKGGTFSEGIRNYGKQRMTRDDDYRKEVFDALKSRKQREGHAERKADKP